MAVLMQMGLDGVSQLPDGSIRLPDGRIVGNFGLDGEGRDGDDSDAGGAGGAGGGGLGRGSYMSGVLKGLPSGVRVMVEGLEAEVRRLKVKIQVSGTFQDNDCFFSEAVPRFEELYCIFKPTGKTPFYRKINEPFDRSCVIVGIQRTLF